MREIKFRARQIEHGEMAFGLIICNYAVNCWYIENEEGRWKIIDRDTVGQFTGLYDRKGKGIYEGDILRRPEYAAGQSDYVVGFEKGHFTLQHTKTAYNQLGIWNIADTTEVVGNIHENPELLTKEMAE